MPTASGYLERILYRFRGGADGANPMSTIVAGADGTLYGTTQAGGGTACGSGCGTIFKLTPMGRDYHETVVHRFGARLDGIKPNGRLLLDHGNIYGTTELGGTAGLGTAFVLAQTGTGYAERVLHSFRGNADGATPSSGLIVDAAGNLYGETSAGGGTVYKLAPARGDFTESVVHAFGGSLLAEGRGPAGGLTLDAAGALYGTTLGGGIGDGGTLFRIAP